MEIYFFFLEKPGSCPPPKYWCLCPVSYHLSARYRCYYDSMCVKDYKCCCDNCFYHKVCKKPIQDEVTTIVTPTIEVEPKVNKPAIEVNVEDGDGSGSGADVDADENHHIPPE